MNLNSYKEDHELKKVVKWRTVIFLILLQFLLVSCGQSLEISKKEKAKLPALKLPQSASTIKEFKSVDTKLIDSSKLTKDKSKNVYKIKQIDGKNKIAELIKSFGMNGATIKEDKEDLIEANYENKKSIILSKLGGGYVYYNLEAMNKKKDITKSAPTEEVCLDIVIKFLKDNNIIKEEMILRDGKETVLNHSTGEKSIESRDLFLIPKSLEDNELSTVQWLRVKINNEGEIESIVSNLKAVELIGTYPIISTDQVIEKVRKKEIAISSTKNNADTLYLENIELTYLDKGPLSLMNDTIQPIYMVSGKVDSMQSEDFFNGIVPGVDSKYIEAPKASVTSSEKEHLTISKKEFNLKEPESYSSNSKGSKEEVYKFVNKLLCYSDGNISAFGNVNNISHKFKEKSSKYDVIKMNYKDYAKISLQTKSKTIPDKYRDKYENVSLDINEIAIFYETVNNRLVVELLGKEDGMFIEYTDESAISEFKSLVK